MCKMCEKDGISLYAKNIETKIGNSICLSKLEIGVRFYSMDSEMAVTIGDESTTYSDEPIQINYCPFCGRQLNDNANKES